MKEISLANPLMKGNPTEFPEHRIGMLFPYQERQTLWAYKFCACSTICNSVVLCSIQSQMRWKLAWYSSIHFSRVLSNRCGSYLPAVWMQCLLGGLFHDFHMRTNHLSYKPVHGLTYTSLHEFLKVYGFSSDFNNIA